MRRVISRILGFFLATAAVFGAVARGQAGEAVMVVEAHSGKVLIGKNTTEKRPVASLTKMATGILALDWAEAAGIEPVERELVVPASVGALGGANPLKLAPGERLTLDDALYSALLGSDNAAAQAIADHVGREFLARRGRSGDPVAAFVAEMDNLCDALGMKRTRFVNPHGLEGPGKVGVSTAADMAKLSIYVARKPAFTFITRQSGREIGVTGVDGTRRTFKVRNTNELAGEPHIIGLKTGTTRAAGECLAVAVERDPLVRPRADGSKGVTPRRLIVVLLRHPDRFGAARALVPRGWQLYDDWVNRGAPVENRKREILPVPDPR